MVNWADLPTDPLRSILSRLPVADFIRFRTVCHSWRFAAAEFRRIPYLIFRGDAPSAAAFFSVSEGKTYTIRCPEPDIRGRILAGTSHGWLVTAYQGLRMHLLNPITGVQIELPSATVGITFSSFQAAVLSSGPSYPSNCTVSNPRNCTVVLLHRIPRLLSFARAGDEKWTSISTDLTYQDIAYHNSRLFLLDNDGGVYAWDLTNPSSKPSIVAVADPQMIPQIEAGLSCLYVKYLIPTSSGDLLQVWQAIDIFNQRPGINVYRVNPDEGRISKVNNLGDQALFLSAHSSVCFPVADISRLKRNHIYFTYEYYAEPRDHSQSVLGVCAYNLEYGSMEQVFNHTLSVNPPYPVWVMPSLS